MSDNIKHNLERNEFFRHQNMCKATYQKLYFLQCPAVGCKIKVFAGFGNPPRIKFQKATQVRLQLEEKSTNNQIEDIIQKENANIIEGREAIKKLDKEMELNKKKFDEELALAKKKLEKDLAVIKTKKEKIEKENRKRARTVENLQSVQNNGSIVVDDESWVDDQETVLSTDQSLSFDNASI